MKALIATALLATTAALPASPAGAQQADAARAAVPPAPRTATPPPRLIVAISIDQLSADLFAQYRNHFTGGFARLLNGAVFPSGYQSHAATETCPGHSTILTGYRPANTGIIANSWVDQRAGRPDKIVYCAEDERVAGSTHDSYTVSDTHLKVPTLGERMKAANAATRVVSVAGKDRAAVMMGGHTVDELWWWGGKSFVSYAGRAMPAVLSRANAATAAMIAQVQPALPLPGFCKPLDRPITINGTVYGQGRFARAANDAKGFRVSPAADAAVFALAAGLVQDMKLGQGSATDIIAVGASATDYIGHTYGTQGTEMCIQMAELDRSLGGFFDVLDATGVDYEVMVTADHGAHDATERQMERAMPMEEHMAENVLAKQVGTAIARDMGLPGSVLLGTEGDVYVDATLPAATRAKVLAEAIRRYRAMPQIAAAFTAAEIMATPMPTSPPETWSLIERARASFTPERSGQLIALLKPRVTSIVAAGNGYIETHGSPWDYDRRVPILFWRKGMTPFEQPLSVETVDIMPTLAGTIRLPVSGQDGRCLDLDPGPATTCPM